MEQLFLQKKIYQENSDIYFMPDQYNNDSNWKAHYETTAKEIWEQTDHRVTHFIAGIGTGGTIMGTTRRLKEFNPSIQGYALEPKEELHGIEGLKNMGSSIIPGIIELAICFKPSSPCNSSFGSSAYP